VVGQLPRARRGEPRARFVRDSGCERAMHLDDAVGPKSHDEQRRVQAGGEHRAAR
jgi:hypothetical protein